MKKIKYILIITLFFITLSACGKDDKPKTTDDNKVDVPPSKPADDSTSDETNTDNSSDSGGTETNPDNKDDSIYDDGEKWEGEPF